MELSVDSSALRRGLDGGSRLKAAGLWLLLVLVLCLHGLPLVHPGWQAGFHPPQFVVPARAPAPPAAPLFQEEIINPDSPLPMAHVASVCELPGGRLAAVWYAGSREGARDVALYFATHAPDAATWSAPRAIMTRELAERDLDRHIKKLGNPVLFSEASGRLWLLYVSISLGGWSGSSINLTSSEDGGRSWSSSRRLTLNPFFNLGELVRGRPVPLSGGSWSVPIYQELAGRVSELLWLEGTATEPHLSKTRVLGGRTGYQPTLTPLDANTALAFHRDYSSQHNIWLSRTETAARDWSAAQPLGLPNPDSGLGALRLTDGRLLLFFNDSREHRDNLRLAVSDDDGQTWTRRVTLAENGALKVCYPYAIQTRDGQIHLVYTWGKNAIKHVVFNAAWLSSQPTLTLP